MAANFKWFRRAHRGAPFRCAQSSLQGGLGMNVYLAVVPIVSIIALAFVGWLAYDVLRRDMGTPEMEAVHRTINEGAVAFLRRQYTTTGILAVITAIIIGLLIGPFERFPEVAAYRNNSLGLGMLTGLAFLVGAAASALSGIIGMYVAVKSNVRVASAARAGVGPALLVALRGGAVSGFLVVTLSLIGVFIMFVLYGGLSNPQDAPFLIVGTGFGASFVALFAQLGGGIYTKAADVGADLVGKVEANIPEDDPRNPAVIADLVGDNVGDCAGRGADLFESTAAENIGAMIIGVVLFPFFGIPGIIFPLVARGFGVLACIVGVYAVKAREGEDPMSALNRGYLVATVLAAALFGVAAWAMLEPTPGTADPLTWARYWVCGIVGMVTAFLYVWITQYYTEAKYRPVKDIAKASETGPATNIISGFSVGLEATWLPIIVVSGALLVSYWLGQTTGISGGGLYGTAIATMGMLSTAAYILAMDTFGPIVDNGAGIIEMSGMSQEARRNMDKLDAAGNTTKALTKGYAVGSAALAAFLLFNAYLEETGISKFGVNIAHPETFIGGFLGAALVFLFTAYAIRAVG